ncbi:unnamed protein product [Clavelina lepadiformis]|uniref:Fibrinogen C-terminal domain-containing protein n=1 Tax=Clavelina lepadiformis TaxID=159417 RepID=A0ABP0GZ44_CLALP
MPTSCKDIVGQTGLHLIQPDPATLPFVTYCDMDSTGEGWTLVAAVHENNIQGKCTVGDKWSSEQEYSSKYLGSKNWENFNVFGDVLDLTWDDYKNVAYHALQASNVMLWHVPNALAISEISDQAYLKYYTNDNVLDQYGGSLRSLYANYAPLNNAGPSRFYELIVSPIEYIKGSKDTIMADIPSDEVENVQPGFIQFRAFDTFGFPQALCPGVKMVTGDSARICVGGNGAAVGDQIRVPSTRRKVTCGDYAGWNGKFKDPGLADVPSSSGRSQKYINSSILIFVK